LPRQPYSLLYWTRPELDAYLVASPIRERAIQRITDVVGTYNDLRDRIFSKHSDLFPEEVCFTKVSMFFVETNDTRGLSDLDSTF
jgi:hypothetical protein